MNAINLPMSPTPFELHPEDIMLGTEPVALDMLPRVDNKLLPTSIFLYLFLPCPPSPVPASVTYRGK